MFMITLNRILYMEFMVHIAGFLVGVMARLNTRHLDDSCRIIIDTGHKDRGMPICVHFRMSLWLSCSCFYFIDSFPHILPINLLIQNFWLG